MHDLKTNRQAGLAVAIGALPALFLLLTSVADITSLGMYDGKRLIQLWMWPVLIASSLIVPSIRRRFAQRLTQIPTWILSLIAMFLALGLASAMQLTQRSYALAEVGLWFLMALGVLIVASIRDVGGRSFDRMAALLLALTGAGVFLMELMGLAAAWSQGFEFHAKSSMIRFLHPRFYNQLQTWTLPLLAALPLLFPEHRRAGWFVAALLSVQWYLLLMTGARGSILSLGIAIALFAVFSPRLRRTWLLRHIGGIAGGVLVFYCVLTASGRFTGSEGEVMLQQSVARPLLHTTGRTDIWNEALGDAINSPWLGAGPARFGCDASIYLPGHQHNIVLQIAGEWGFPAMLVSATLVGGLLLLLFRGLLRHKSGGIENLTLRTALAAGLLAALVHSMVSGLLVTPASQVAAVLVMGWFVGTFPAAETERRSAATLPLFALGLAVSIAILQFAQSELRQLDVRTAYAEQYGPMTPRFWTNGRVCLYTWGQEG